jgi:peptidoglycan L-alanyl-D-glutamate endopeptidase CwlK
MPSRSLADLRAPFRARAEAWAQACEQSGLDILIYCTLRSLDEQQALYAQGRTAPGRIVTYARAGSSAHNFGLALDFVPLVGGKAEWRAPSPRWEQAIQIAEAFGMESASKWQRFKEWPHLQEPNWRSFVQ